MDTENSKPEEKPMSEFAELADSLAEVERLKEQLTKFQKELHRETRAHMIAVREKAQAQDALVYWMDKAQAKQTLLRQVLEDLGNLTDDLGLVHQALAERCSDTSIEFVKLGAGLTELVRISSAISESLAKNEEKI